MKTFECVPLLKTT